MEGDHYRLNLYVNWRANTYTITYQGNGNDGGSTASTTCTYGTNCTLQANGFSKTGYAFSYWSGSNGGSYSNSQTIYYNIAGDLTLTAQWTGNPYTITYQGNGNTGGSMAPTPCTYGSSCTLRQNEFSRTGYTFNNWLGSNGVFYSNLYRFDNGIIGDLTMTANWTPNAYTITYQGNGNTGGSMEDTPCTYGANCNLRPNGFSRTGYTFSGWSGSNGGSYGDLATIYYNIADNLIMTANWIADSYIVTYNSNGGVDCNPKTKSVTFGKKYGTLCTPTRTGYNFNGWYTAKSGGSKVESSTKVTTAGKHTIYAHWTAKPIWIYYNANGGSITTASSKLGFSVRKSDSQILRNGEEYHNKPVNYGETRNLSNYNYSEFIELKKANFLVENGKEWNTKWKSNELKTGIIFSQSDNISYEKLKNASISQNGNQDNQDYYKLNLYVYWRTCGGWNYSYIDTYNCKCSCSPSAGSAFNDVEIKNSKLASCKLVCQQEGYVNYSGTCSRNTKQTTCNTYN